MNNSTTIKTIGTIASLAIAASLLASGASRHALKSNGEIIGIVEGGSGRVAGAVVSLEANGSFSAPSSAVTMDQAGKEFLPHVLAVMKGTTVKFQNSDPFFHNVFSNSRVKMFNVSQTKKGDESTMTFDKVGIVPIRCHIHPNMKAFIVVLPNPYFDVSNEKGQFTIGNVPAGTYTIKVWSEQGVASSQSIEVPASGRAKVIFKVAG